MQKRDVVVIGGGLSGLVACKHLLAAGLDCVVLEGSDDIGGVWKYREEPNGKGGVMLSTVSTSSKTVNEFSDFPMPDHYPAFQKHTLVMDYLNDYADHFGLRDSIRLNTEVVDASKREDGWETRDNHGNEYKSRYLIVCSGMHQFPDKFYLEDERFREATVEMTHSSDYRRITEKFLGKDVLIFGGGETGSDIAIELTHAASSVTMAVPHGQWLFPSITPVHVPTNSSDSSAMVADTFSSRLRRLVDPPFATYESALDTKAHFTSQTFIKWGGKCGHGIPEWENEAPYYGQFFNKNSNVIQMVHRGVISPKGNIRSVEGDVVKFVDGSEKRVDIIVFCTGYQTRFPFFKDDSFSCEVNDQFKFLLCNEDPSLAFIGFARPLVGSFMGLSEMQAIYVSKIFSGEVDIPDREYRDSVIQEDKVFQELTFSSTTNRIGGLVNFQSYLDDLATLAGVRPDYVRLFFSSPRKWYYAVTAAHNNCQFLLNDEKYHDEIFRRYRRYHGNNLRVSTHIYALIVNLFPAFFTGRFRIFVRLRNAFFATTKALLILLFSPVLLYRILFPIEKRWKRKKRQMMQDDSVADLLNEVRAK
jgi:dimethylaniline monooxygenase (N-oxide forming)